MSSLLASHLLAPLVGTGVFGVTAAVGYLLTKGPETEEDRDLIVPGPATAAELLAKERVKWRGMGSDRRESFRRYGTPLKVVVADTERDEIATGWVVDRSSGGLGLELDLPMPAGSVLNLRPCQTQGMKVWVEGVVRNCRNQVDYWKVGCQFVRTPPWDVLRLFG